MKGTFALNSTCVNLSEYFGKWIKGFPKLDRQLVLVGVAAMFWMIWRCCNGIFLRRIISNPMAMIKHGLVYLSDKGVRTKGAKAEGKTQRAGSKRASQGWRPRVLRIGG